MLITISQSSKQGRHIAFFFFLFYYLNFFKFKKMQAAKV